MQPDGGGGGTGHTLEIEIPIGNVDDSNTKFMVINTPLFISVNGAIYTVGTGLFTSFSTGVITLSSPVGQGGFITSFYNA